MSVPKPTAEGLHPVLDERARLRVMTMLCALEEDDEMTVQRLHELLDLSSDAVHAALDHLAAAGWATVAAGARGSITGTWAGSTRAGRAAFRAHVAAIGAQLAIG